MKFEDGDLVFIRNNTTFYTILTSVSSGISHVSMIYNNNNNELYLSSMSRITNKCIHEPISKLNKWNYVKIIRLNPPLTHKEKQILQEQCKKSTDYCLLPYLMTKKCTNCTQHVLKMLRQINKAPVSSSNWVLPNSILNLPHTVIFEKGTSNDVPVLIMMIMIIMIIMIIIIIYSKHLSIK